MKNAKTHNSYNDRLFSKKNFIRYLFHTSRFLWLNKTIKRLKIKYSNVIELGCFDGKALDYLPTQPIKYDGFDKNWEGGLDKAKHRKKEGINFNYAALPKDLPSGEKTKYELGICMETLEHIPPKLVCPYLEKLSKLINGHLLITVPNEKGVFFLLKRLLKPRQEEFGAYKFNFREYIYLLFGKTNMVERNEHKGFDYDHLIYDIRKYFDIVEVNGYPKYFFLPLFLSFGAGIVAKSKKVTELSKT